MFKAIKYLFLKFREMALEYKIDGLGKMLDLTELGTEERASIVPRGRKARKKLENVRQKIKDLEERD